MSVLFVFKMSAAAIQLKIDKLEADIIAIESNIKLSEELKLQYINSKEEMIIILENKIEKLSPAVNPTQTGKKMFKVICLSYAFFH